MDEQRYYDRKQYAEQARNSFGLEERSGKRSSRESYDRETDAEEKRPRSFFKVRLFLAVLLFAGFFLLRATGWSYLGVDAEAIQDKIAGDIALPDSFPRLSDAVSVFEGE
ncbi:MAG: hypothetical protein LUD01_04865 [Clostridiales bacterium]|nr:hypothetical protein [Clostridiales bacterium]